MKKSYIYAICIAVFLVAVVGIVYKYNRKTEDEENKVYGLLERKGAAAQSKEWAEVKSRADGFIKTLKDDPTNMKAALQLAQIFIQEARETGNYVYYDKAAMKNVNIVLNTDPSNFNALVYKSLIYLSQHHFADGLATAKQAQQVNPNNAYVYGLMVDGYVEMGQYDSAIANADRMVAIRPDLASYSRISYLREIFGNYKNAIEAMKMAVDAGGRGDEHTEWTRVQLGSLYEKLGDFRSADSLYVMSLSMRPDYPYALAGRARVALANNDYKSAIAYYEKADMLITDNSMKEELVDLYRHEGQKEKADQLAQTVVDDLSKDSKAGDKDESIGHYADRELAYAYLKLNQNDKALEHALLEYNRRPDNIDVNETVAWVYYSRGDYAKALPYIKTAMKTNSKNPVLLNRAGMIYFKSGDKQMAKTILQEAASSNAQIGLALKQETSAAMQTM